MRAALGFPGEIQPEEECKNRGQQYDEAEEEDSLKQELVVRQAVRAAAFLAVVVAELDLPPLDDFILMLSNRCPVDSATPSTMNDDIDDDMVVVDSVLERGGVEAAAYQQNGGTNGNRKRDENIVDIVENGVANGNDNSNEGEKKKNQENSECGGEMLQSKNVGGCCKEAENWNNKETVYFQKLNDATTCTLREDEEEGQKRGECADNKVQQVTEAPALPQPMHIWTEECHTQFGEWLDPRECIFCHDVGDSVQAGRLLPFEDSQWVHVNCLTWSSEVYESSSAHGELRGAHTARSRSKLLRCSVCGERGATIDCQRKLCKLIFHFPCAVIAKVRFCKDRTVWCNFHANCIPSARQKVVADFPTAALDAKSLNCDIAKHLRIAPFREIPTGSVATAGIPLTGGGGGEAKHQAGGSMEPASIASQQKAALTTSPPGGIQTNFPAVGSGLGLGSASLSPPPPPPPADFTL